MSPLSIGEIERQVREATERSQQRRQQGEGAAWHIGLAIFLLLGLITLFLLAGAAVTSIAHAATVNASASRIDASTLSIRLNVTVRHGTSIYVEGCADLDGILACGNGAGVRRKVHRGSNRLTVRVSSTVMRYTPPPSGYAGAWDAWEYGPGQTDVAFLYFKNSGRLTEVRPTAIAAETLTDRGM